MDELGKLHSCTGTYITTYLWLPDPIGFRRYLTVLQNNFCHIPKSRRLLDCESPFFGFRKSVGSLPWEIPFLRDDHQGV